MGAGKTSAAIDYINKSDDSVRFLYITPYITEVDRIINSCPSKNFVQPSTATTKLSSIKKLFASRANIVSTHALFSRFDDEVIDLAYNNGYILIMDEVADVVTTLDISAKDAGVLLEKYVSVGDDSLLTWTDEEYEGRFEDYKRLCKLGAVALYGNSLMLWMLPIKAFTAFSDIFILTYMFDAQVQRYYYDYYGVGYEYIGVELDDEGYHFCESSRSNYKFNYGELIHICDDPKLNRIGDKKYDLSKAWYERNQKNDLIEQLKNNLYTYFRRRVTARSRDIIWTTFIKYRPALAYKGYAKGFISCNMRAVNDYGNKTVLAYTVNRFLLPAIKNFFVERGVEVDEDRFALAEMLQWIWRSAIRNNQDVWIYIPSARMRNLLQEWMDGLNGDK